MPMAMSFFFAGDLAAIIPDQIGIRYTDQYALTCSVDFVLFRSLGILLNTGCLTDYLWKTPSDVVRTCGGLP